MAIDYDSTMDAKNWQEISVRTDVELEMYTMIFIFFQDNIIRLLT